MPVNMTEIRWHGRGGQGAKTAAQLMAKVAAEEGNHSQGCPEYGPERTGAPIRAYTRISEGPIDLHCAINEPDVVVVLDESLLDSESCIDGVKEGGKVLVNTTHSPQEMRSILGCPESVKVMTIDATGISIDEIGRPFPNTPMTGALIRATGAIKLESLFKDIEKKFKRKGAQIVEGNIRCLKRAYDEVNEG